MIAILIRRYAMPKDRAMPSVHVYRGHSPFPVRQRIYDTIVTAGIDKLIDKI